MFDFSQYGQTSYRRTGSTTFCVAPGWWSGVVVRTTHGQRAHQQQHSTHYTDHDAPPRPQHRAGGQGGYEQRKSNRGKDERQHKHDDPQGRPGGSTGYLEENRAAALPTPAFESTCHPWRTKQVPGCSTIRRRKQTRCRPPAPPSRGSPAPRAATPGTTSTAPGTPARRS